MKTRILSVIAIGAILMSCKKEEVPVAQNTSPGTPTPQFADVDGVLAAINTVTKQSQLGFEFEVNVGLGTAFFFENRNTATFIDAGAVSVNETNLNKQSGNSYVSQPSPTDPTGIEFSNSASWTVGGSAGVSAFNASLSTFPSTPKLNAITELTAGQPVTISLSQAVSGADSILFVIGAGASITKSLSAGSTSVTFSGTETAKLSKGTGLIQVAPYRYKFETVGNKRYVLVNEAVVSNSITVK